MHTKILEGIDNGNAAKSVWLNMIVQTQIVPSSQPSPGGSWAMDGQDYTSYPYLREMKVQGWRSPTWNSSEIFRNIIYGVWTGFKEKTQKSPQLNSQSTRTNASLSLYQNEIICSMSTAKTTFHSIQENTGLHSRVRTSLWDRPQISQLFWIQTSKYHQIQR